MPAYQEAFPINSVVKVKDRSFLESFQRSWKLHHPISDRQLKCAGKEGRVDDVGFYFGGDPLYTIDDMPGLWHEQCLENAKAEGKA